MGAILSLIIQSLLLWATAAILDSHLLNCKMVYRSPRAIKESTLASFQMKMEFSSISTLESTMGDLAVRKPKYRDFVKATPLYAIVLKVPEHFRDYNSFF